MLWGTGGEELRTAVVAAHERALASTLSFLQDHAAFTRRGAGGVFQVDTEGFVAASFLHRTSRAADPQLHTHVLLANKVRAEDGRWLSLDGRELYEHQKAAGMLYRAALRAELTASLGVCLDAGRRERHRRDPRRAQGARRDLVDASPRSGVLRRRARREPRGRARSRALRW